MKDLLHTIVANDVLHAKFLNTLSLMENTGARKISSAQSLETVNVTMLKHAAEEHRHAFYLKKQLLKLHPDWCKTYQYTELLAPVASKQYLYKLDIAASRYLRKELNLSHTNLRFAAYLMVTYVIEVRADELYPIYQEVLSTASSRINVKSIILEEQGHLEEMIDQLNRFSPAWEQHVQKLLSIEHDLYAQWVQQIKDDVYVLH